MHNSVSRLVKSCAQLSLGCLRGWGTGVPNISCVFLCTRVLRFAQQFFMDNNPPTRNPTGQLIPEINLVLWCSLQGVTVFSNTLSRQKWSGCRDMRLESVVSIGDCKRVTKHLLSGHPTEANCNMDPGLSSDPES